MYKVVLECEKKGKTEIMGSWELGGEDESSRSIMNEIADALYDLPIRFEVDQDGDMLIDDVLIDISEREDTELEFKSGKDIYRLTGKNMK